MFGHLQEGKRNSYDPMQFARLLQLDRGEQQDPVEFSRLFLQVRRTRHGTRVNRICVHEEQSMAHESVVGT